MFIERNCIKAAGIVVSWKWWLLIHLHAVPISTLPSAVHTWLMCILILPFYAGRSSKSSPVTSLLCQVTHKMLHQRITISKKSQGKASWLASWGFLFIYVFFLALWTYLKLFLTSFTSKPSLRQMRTVGPGRSAEETRFMLHANPFWQHMSFLFIQIA